MLKGVNMESFDINSANFMSSSLYRGYAAKTPIKSITIVKNNLINRRALKSITLDTSIVENSTVENLDADKTSISMKIKI